MVILPLIAFIGCWTALYVRNRDWRGSFIEAAILWGVWLALATETLSGVFWISRLGLAAAWLLAAVLAWLVAIRRMKMQSAAFGDSPGQTVAVKLSAIERASIAAIAVILALTAVVAIAGAPNSWDSMQYNMPRAIMWLENHSVRMYPTVDYQQLMMSPWADYAMMHLIALQGSDRFADLVSWFSFAGSIIGVSLIARELGGSRSAQLLASLFCATIPSAILFASSSKPDETIGFWVVACVYCLLRCRAAPNWMSALFATAAIGLAVMTKGTAYALLPALLAAVFWIWSADRRKRLLAWIPAAAIVLLMLNGPLYVRNIRLSGSPLGFASPDGDADTLGQRHFANAVFKPQDIAANVLRNAVLHLGTTGRIDALTEEVFRGMIRGLGVDPDDPRMIEGGNSGGAIPFGVTSLSLTETRAGNPLVLFLFLATLPLISRLRPPLRRDIGILAIGLIGAFVLFSASIRWQPWNGRFHLPLFIVACAVIAVVLSEVCPQWIIALVAAIAIVGAVPFTLLNSPRPLLQIREAHRRVPVPSILRMGRDKIYFADQHLYLADSFLAAARLVQGTGCRNVGLDASVQHYDYPMLALLKAGVGGPNVHYVGVHNRSTAFPTGAGDPCAVVCLGCNLVNQKSTKYGGPSVFSASFDRVEVFLRSEPRARQKQAAIPPSPGDCGLLPLNQLGQLLGDPVSPAPSANSCAYQGPAGRVLVRELPNGTDAPNFDDLAGEAMGSLPGGGAGYSTVIVFDGGWSDRPVLMYVSKNDRLFGINLDLKHGSARNEDFVSLANELRTDRSALRNTASH
jgi:dolichyl-phosphate-mannose-protein mannosyltransferase